MTIEELGLSAIEQHRTENMRNTLDSGTRDLHSVAEEFESLFVKNMVKSMRNTLQPENNFLYGGFAEEVFQDMMDTEYSRLLAETQSFGFAEMIIQQYEQHSTTIPTL